MNTTWDSSSPFKEWDETSTDGSDLFSLAGGSTMVPQVQRRADQNRRGAEARPRPFGTIDEKPDPDPGFWLKTQPEPLPSFPDEDRNAAPLDTFLEEDILPNDWPGRAKRTGRTDGLFEEFATALERYKAAPGETGYGRHDLSEDFATASLYPHGSRHGNQTARDLFAASPALHEYLTGEAAPPLPFGTYVGQGWDHAAARQAKAQSRDFASFKQQVEEAEQAPAQPAQAGQPEASFFPTLPDIGQGLSDFAGKISDFFSPGEAYADTGVDGGNTTTQDVGATEPANKTQSETTPPQEPQQEQTVQAEQGPETNNCQDKTVVRDLTPEERDRLMEVSKGYAGTRWEGGKNGENGAGIDCSRHVGLSYKKAGFDFGTPDSQHLPTSGQLYFEKVDKPEKGDVVQFTDPKHVGFYDPDGETSGKPLWSATQSGGVRNTGYEHWTGGPTFLRLKIAEKQAVCD